MLTEILSTFSEIIDPGTSLHSPMHNVEFFISVISILFSVEYEVPWGAS